MFRRAFWFSAGAAAGVWATTRVHQKIRSLAPGSLPLRAAGKAVDGGRRVRAFALEVGAGMAQREHELQEALGLRATPPDRADQVPGERGTEIPGRRIAGRTARGELGPPRVTVHGHGSAGRSHRAAVERDGESSDGAV